MKIELRVTGKSESISNVIFKPIKEFKMTLFPLPPNEWVGKQKCYICNNEPHFLMDSFQPICRECIKSMMKGLNAKEAMIDTNTPITMNVINKTRFEWSLDGEKWYSLMGKNIKSDKPELFLKELRFSMINNKPITIEADYDKETKIMTIIL